MRPGTYSTLPEDSIKVTEAESEDRGGDVAIRRIGSCPCMAVNELEMKSLVEAAIRARQSGYTVAVNAEKILAYHEDPVVANIIDDALFPYPDGAGAGRRQPVARDREADEVSHNGAVREIKRRFSQLNLAESSHGYIPTDEIVSLIVRSEAEIVLIALGSPKQEKIASQAIRSGACCLIIGCGGALDILSGKSRRAPNWMVHGNLEWLYRLTKEPWRWRRQLKLVRFFALLGKLWLKSKRRR